MREHWHCTSFQNNSTLRFLVCPKCIYRCFVQTGHNFGWSDPRLYLSFSYMAEKKEKNLSRIAFWKPTICTVKHAFVLLYNKLFFEADAWLLLAIDTVMFCRDHYESDLGFRSSLKQPCKCEMYLTRKRSRRRTLICVKWFCTILLLNCIVVDAFEKDCVKICLEWDYTFQHLYFATLL